MADVSVVMGAYNAAATIERAVVSILEQTYEDLELIVVDDGSSDATPELLGALAARDSRIRVLRTENRGLTRALITGCGEARGGVIVRQDADDWSEPERIESQFALLASEPAVGFVTCDVMWHAPEGTALRVVAAEPTGVDGTLALVDRHIGPPAHGSVMFRRDLYQACGGYRSQFYFAQDIDLWLRLSESSLLGSVDRVLYHHVRDPESISGAARSVQWTFGALAWESAALRRAGEDDGEVLDRARALTVSARDGASGSHARRDRAMAAYNLGVALLERRNSLAKRYFARAVLLDPTFVKSFARLIQSFVLLAVRESTHRSPGADEFLDSS